MKNIIKALVPEAIKTNLKSRQQKKALKEQFLKGLRSTDVFLVGHPKSGNTWLAYMLGIVSQGENHESVNLKNVSQFIPTIHSVDEKICESEHLSSPRVFRNEGPVFPELYPKTIYIVRDPRAVLLSYYHHWLHTDSQDHGTLEEFIDEILVHGCIRRWDPWLLGWEVQVLAWTARANQQAVKIVRYEDLIENRKETFRDVLDFCEMPCDDALFLTAVERGDFQSMRKVEQQHGAESYPGEEGNDKEEKGFFVRKGVVDSWKEEMPENVIQKIEKKFHQTMKNLGYLPK